MKGRRDHKFNGRIRVNDRRSDFNLTSGRQARARLKTLDDLDKRSRAIKLARRFTSGMTADLGGEGNLTHGQRELVHRAAMCSVLLGDMEARWIRGEEKFNVNDYTKLINTQHRVIAELGLKRLARDVTPTLDQYRQRRIAEPAEGDE